MPKTAISITLEDRLLQKVDKLARESARPRSWFFSNAISYYLVNIDNQEEAKKMSQNKILNQVSGILKSKKISPQDYQRKIRREYKA